MKAKEDKCNILALLDTSRTLYKIQLDQWRLISVCIVALKHFTKDAWIKSFIRVNLHPDYRLSFVDWIKKIETQIVAGESFFKCRTSLYDILPQFWKTMTPVDRSTVVNKIDGYYASEEVTWSKKITTVSINYLFVSLFVMYFMSNQYCSHILFLLQELLYYVPVNNMVRLSACYLTTKQDSSTIHRIQEKVVNSN